MPPINAIIINQSIVINTAILILLIIIVVVALLTREHVEACLGVDDGRRVLCAERAARQRRVRQQADVVAAARLRKVGLVLRADEQAVAVL